MFESISYHSDSAEKLNECKYQAAYALFNSGSYAEAKNKFVEISSYSNSNEMASECDYSIAMNYKNNGEYVKALKAFNDLGSYKDSASQFANSERLLKQSNQRNGYYSNEYAMSGNWQDTNGNYVQYINKGNESYSTSYNLSYTHGGDTFKFENSIHYNKSGSSGWIKQWIFQRIDSNNAQVYDYIDGQIYNLCKN